MSSVIGRGRYATRTYPGRDGSGGFLPALGVGVVHSLGGGLYASSPIVNADVAADAAILGTKISPDFGAQNVTTTGAYVGTTVDILASGVLTRFAAASITMAQPLLAFDAVVAAPMIGQSGSAGQNLTVFAQSHAAVVADAQGGRLFLRGGNASLGTSTNTGGGVRIIPGTGTGVGAANGEVRLQNAAGTDRIRVTDTNVIVAGDPFIDLTAGVSRFRFAQTGASFEAPALFVGSGSTTVTITQPHKSGGVGSAILIRGQDVYANGIACTGGSLEIAGGLSGEPGFPPTASTGGALLVHGGDAGNGTVSNVGAPLTLRGGRATGAGAVDSNIALHADPASYQSMVRGIFIGNATVAPAGDPVAGGFLYVTAGALFWRGSAGTVTPIAAA